MQPMLDTSHLPRVPEWKKAGDFEDILYGQAAQADVWTILTDR